MNGIKLVCLGLLVLASCMMVSAQLGTVRKVRLAYGDYDCSCSYYCPHYAIKGGRCYGDTDDYWGWGHTAQYCCVPSAYEDLYSTQDYDNTYTQDYDNRYDSYNPYSNYFNNKK